MPVHVLRCGRNQADSKTEEIDGRGGKVVLRGHQLRVLAGAVTRPTNFTLRIPESERVEIEALADGPFQKPVELTISYAGCTERPKEDLKIWRLSATGEPQEDMGGTDNPRDKKITTSLDHFTGYAVGNGRVDDAT